MENERIGFIAAKLGAGRMKKDDRINNRVGIIVSKKIGDKVQNGEILGYIHADSEQIGNEAAEEYKSCLKISETNVEKQKHILGIVE